MEKKNKITSINCFIHACSYPHVIAIRTCGNMNIGNLIISFGSLVRLAQRKEPLGGKCLLNNSFGSFK